MESMTLQQLLADYRVVRVMGKGSFGTVFLVRSNLTDAEYAMKKYSVSHLIQNGKQNALIRSIGILNSLHHDSVIKVVKYVIAEDEIYLLFDACKKGSLQELKTVFMQCENLNIVLLILYQLCVGLAYLENMSVTHRDIKPSNMVFNRKGQLVIIDFDEAICQAQNLPTLAHLQMDLSKCLIVNKPPSYRLSCADKFVGTFNYMCPQIKFSIAASTKNDVWAFGCIAYQLLTGQQLCTQDFDTPDELEKFITDKVSVHPKIDLQWKNLILSALPISPVDRKTANQMLQIEPLSLIGSNMRLMSATQRELQLILRGNSNIYPQGEASEALECSVIGMEIANEKFSLLNTAVLVLSGFYEQVCTMVSGPCYFKIQDAITPNTKLYIYYDTIDSVSIVQDSILLCMSPRSATREVPMKFIRIQHIYSELLGRLFDLIKLIIED